MSRKSKQQLEKAVQKYHIDRSGATLRQFKLALVEHDLLTEVESTIKNMSQYTQIEWEYTSHIRRKDRWINDLIENTSITENVMDQIFFTAINL